MRRAARGTEDWWALWIGLGLVALSLPVLAGVDVLGWAAATQVWIVPAKAVAAVSKAYAALPGLVSLAFTYLFLLAAMSLGAAALGLDVGRFVAGFSAIFWASWLCWLAGNHAYIAATPDKRAGFGIAWSLALTGEAGFIIALVAGLVVGNFLPRAAAALAEATRPEWYVKTAIVILGASLGVQAAGARGLATAVLFRGLAAIVEAYLIYWAVVYLVARRVFGLTREWAAPLASGVSICGVSAAMATAAAIRARPIVPIMISSLVVLFAVVELLILPFAAQTFLAHQPMVAGAWMGLAVKTDGAAVASGAITDALIRAKAAGAGIVYQEGWILLTTTTVKVFIDMFIGVWAFVLAVVWTSAIDRSGSARASDIWHRFPKFVLGYFVSFVVTLLLVVARPGLLDAAKIATAETNVFRVLFFAMTFFTIGVASDFRKLRQEGIGRLALVYVVCLFGFIIWVGLAVSWIFFHGIVPPRA
ncbi:MAG: putative sulfate exporter family transporter [Deltaproteobacteria bacterium]|nr:MAG: putative sulfate exporter family transporter [Deltaproteobacteria bacterium]